MILLLDIGNTHTHLGLANRKRILRTREVPTADVRSGGLTAVLRSWLKGFSLEGACLCSVVPKATGPARRAVYSVIGILPEILGPDRLPGIEVRYPQPRTIGPDRLANAVAARHHFGTPVVVVDFGTAVTFDVVDGSGHYVGGIIAPGLAMMTDYLHERTALLPKVRIREPRRVIGRNTRQAMLSGAVLGYRGMIRELVAALRREVGVPGLPVVATGGYAELVSRPLPEISAIRPHLTLEGLRLTWEFRQGQG
jgi:type III pantothenate kinase